MSWLFLTLLLLGAAYLAAMVLVLGLMHAACEALAQLENAAVVEDH